MTCLDSSNDGPFTIKHRNCNGDLRLPGFQAGHGFMFRYDFLPLNLPWPEPPLDMEDFHANLGLCGFELRCSAAPLRYLIDIFALQTSAIAVQMTDFSTVFCESPVGAVRAASVQRQI